MGKLIAAANIMLLSMGLSLDTHAVIVKLADLQTMAEKSEVVLHGYVGEQRVDYDSLGRIVTLSTLEVIDGLLNTKTGELVTIYQVGGELNGAVMPVLGGHVYKLGQELIFFGLKLEEKLVSFGLGQGKLDINAHDSETPVKEDLGNVSAKGIGADNISVTMPLAYSSLELLKDEIRLIIKNRPNL